MDSSVDDGITIEPGVGINMAWSHFEHDKDVDVKILRRDGTSSGPTSGVVVRSTTIKYSLSAWKNGGIVIRVPKDPNGRKFSVEFDSHLYTYRSDGSQYVASGSEVVGIEPRNALVIFASPFLPNAMIPEMNSNDTHMMKPGPINNGDWGSSPILYFPPGVYWMNQDQSGNSPKYGQSHMKLHSNTYWVYLAPGAYVKGVVEYLTKQDFYATGHGVLSGEHYMYQANPATYYQGKKDGLSLRLWSHYNLGGGQTWYCMGPTISSPPFNTMDFYGSSDISVQISDYKQVGAFFFQTDGPQMYPNSRVHDVFYHVNDDAIKTYYSGVSVSRITVWKCHNDPIIQMGWSVRNVSGITIDTLNIIHTRHIKPEMVVPSAIIGASPCYASGLTVDLNQSVSMTISNVVCEGLYPALFRITPLQSYRDFVVKNVALPDGLQRNSIGTGESIIPAAPGVMMDLEIYNWTVGGEKVTMSNFQSDSLGQLNIDAQYWGQWSIE